MNQLQQKQYTGKGGIYQQLTLPISENILIDEHEPVYVANAQLEELDYTKLYQAYSSKGRKSAAEPRIMFKLLVYGYMCGIYSTRKLELACPKNIDFIWLLQGERVPDYSSFARFRSGKAKDAVEDLFYQFVQRLPGIETTLTSYSSECHATMLLPSLKQALTNYDKERALYCLGEMDNWYQKNLSKIYSNSYVFHKDEHLRVAELIHLSIQKISESEVAPKSTAIGNEDTPDSTEPIIFLSHCSSDKTYGDILEKFIMGLGVKREQLIYSSHPLHKIPLDQNIFNYLRKNINREIFMIILWSNDYLESPACMNELGAAWVAQCDYTNIYTPDFAFGNPKYHRCAVDTQKMGAVLNGDANCRQSMLELKDKIVNFLDLAPDEAQVLYLLDEFTNSLKAISKTSDRNSAENDLAVR